jgi:NAD(P)H-hydrate epimerase
MAKKNTDGIKPRPKDSHKGNYGHVLVLAGTVGMSGAAYLASQAALFSGSGLVTLGIPKSLNAIMEIKLTEVMTLPLDETPAMSLAENAYSRIEEFSEKADILAVGPGLSTNSQTRHLIRQVAANINKDLVLDADGINAYADDPDALSKRKARLVITPHPGELSRITKESVEKIQQNREASARKASQKLGAVVVLKGSKTVVADGDKIYLNESGNPGMATGGTGDVLTGIIASLIGQGLEPFGASKLGTHVHGLAGDLAMREKGEISLTASDILSKLPAAFKSL